MNARSTSRRTLPLAVLLALAVAPVGATEIDRHGRYDAEPTPMPAPATSRYGEVLLRPLFSPTRRPPAPLAEAPAPMGVVTLTGVVISPNQRLAVVADRDTANSRQVHEGDNLGNAV